MPLGPLSNNKTFVFGKEVQSIQMLGIYFSLDVHIKEEINYKEILSKIKAIIALVET